MGQLPEYELRRLEAISSDQAALETLIGRRLEGEPLQYLEGTAHFVDLELLVDERVLVPRPETEGLFELATKMVRDPQLILDLCTGSGALALALKSRYPNATVYGTDISSEALEVAQANANRNRLAVRFLEGDLFSPLPAGLKGAVDLVVANPPYVAEADFGALPREVKREPRVALVAGSSGLEVIQRFGAEVAEWLRPGGVVVCEIGERQGVSASTSFHDLPTVVRKDLAGRDRYVVAVSP